MLDGKTDIKAGVTYSRFESAPDAPFTVFETVLPAGPHGVLTPNVPENEDYSLCKASLADADRNHRPKRRRDQPDNPIAVSWLRAGCWHKNQAHPGAAARQSAEGVQKVQQDKAKRAACERQARKRYAAKASKRRVGLRPR